MEQPSKICQWCKQSFIPTRSDAIFCSSTCRWNHWKDKKQSGGILVERPEAEKKPALFANLQGVISDTKEKAPLVIDQLLKVTPQYLESKNELDNLLSIKTRLLTDIQTCKSTIQKVELPKDFLFYLVGGTMGYNISSYCRQGTAKSILWAGIGTGVGGFLKTFTEEYRKKREREQLDYLYPLLNHLMRELQIGEQIIEEQRKKLALIPKYLPVPKTGTLPTSDLPSIIPNTNQTLPVHSGRIINSEELVNMDYQALNFKGKWQNFFGFPSVNFHCVIHGMSGEGKSTFALQFAHYLAQNFGTVLYISGEEGFSKTFKDKVQNNEASSRNLFVADLRNFQDIVDEVQDDHFNFIFIDSLDNMKIDADVMKKIRQIYKYSALITISQSTKDGKMRGSYEIVHDSDIAVKVENGIATTTKNRFKQKGMEIRIFDDSGEFKLVA